MEARSWKRTIEVTRWEGVRWTSASKHKGAHAYTCVYTLQTKEGYSNFKPPAMFRSCYAPDSKAKNVAAVPRQWNGNIPFAAGSFAEPTQCED
jgi:hypothetical protein